MKKITFLFYVPVFILLAFTTKTQAQCVAEQTTQNANFLTENNEVGMSFIAPVSTAVESVMYNIVTASVSGTATMTLHDGNTVVNPLGSTTYAISTNGDITVVFPTPIAVTAGNTYTFMINQGTSQADLGVQLANPYPDGELLRNNAGTFGFATNPDADMRFEVRFQDAIAPMITCPANQMENADTACMFAVPDYTGQATVSDNCTANPTVTQSPVPGTMVGLGDTTITLTADDGSGQTTDCTFTLTVEDNTDPVVTCIASDSRNTDMGVCEYTVQGTEFDATFTDNCMSATITNDINNSASLAGAILPTGDTVVTWTVDDGNGQTATCMTTITVEDNEDPLFEGGATSPPDGANYTLDESLTFNYQSIVTTGTNLGNGDDVAFTATLGSPFTLYSNTVNQLRISSNGYISIDLTDSGGDLSNDCPLPVSPSTGPDAPRLYILHDDTDAQPGVTDSGIYYEYFNVSPYPHPNGDAMGASIIEFVGDHFPGAGPSNELQYQAILFDNGDVIYQYLSDVEDGSGSTIGAQESGTGQSLTISCNTAGTSVSAGIYGLSPYGGLLQDSPNSVAEACPMTIIVESDTPDCGAIVEYSTPMAVDNCSGVTVVQTEGMPSGSEFPLGTTTNTFVATDASGNIATCTFDITVQDTTPITIISGPVDIFTGTGANDDDCSTTVNYDEVTIDSFVTEDNCGDSTTITIVQTGGLGSGASFTVGTTIEEYTLTDVNGNETIFTFEVNITDTTLPIIDCSNDDVIVSGDDEGNYMVEDYASTVSDNCSSVADLVITQDPSAGTVVIDPSTTEITLTATDDAGNTTTCTFNLVVDETLGVNDVSLESGLSLYPNPTEDQVTVSAIRVFDAVTVYDLRGRLVVQESVNTLSTSLDMSSFEAGIYLVKITSGTSVVTKRLIKK